MVIEVSSRVALGEQHDSLIKWLIKQLKELGYDKFYVDHLPEYENQRPAERGRHRPDISAYKGDVRGAIGEVKTCDDLSSDTTKEQFEDFSADSNIHLYIVVPDECVEEAKRVARELGIYPKSNVTIW